jgi:hypothetical protein
MTHNQLILMYNSLFYDNKIRIHNPEVGVSCPPLATKQNPRYNLGFFVWYLNNLGALCL